MEGRHRLGDADAAEASGMERLTPRWGMDPEVARDRVELGRA
jgi:hypothetical protein